MFKVYHNLAQTYKGKSETATELAREAQYNAPKEWMIVKAFTKPRGERRIILTNDGNEVVQELRFSRNFDSVIVAKLMCTFETYIKRIVYKYPSFAKEDIMEEAELSLIYALELFEDRETIITKTGKTQKVKFEQAWKTIFDSKVAALHQSSNRAKRKLDHETISYDYITSKDVNFQVMDDILDSNTIDILYKDLKEALTQVRKEKDYASYSILLTMLYPVSIKDNELIFDKSAKILKLSENSIGKVYQLVLNKNRVKIKRDDQKIELKNAFEKVSNLINCLKNSSVSCAYFDFISN